MRFAVLCIGILILATSICTFGADVPATYTSHCSSCHAADGRGKTNTTFKGQIPDLRSKAVQEMSDTDLYETIARGTKHHEYPHAFIYRGLKDKDIQELVKYIRTLAANGK